MKGTQTTEEIKKEMGYIETPLPNSTVSIISGIRTPINYTKGLRIICNDIPTEELEEIMDLAKQVLKRTDEDRIFTMGYQT